MSPSVNPVEPVEPAAVLWDEGALTRSGAEKFAKLAQSVALTAGPRQAPLVAALETVGVSTASLTNQPATIVEALDLAASAGPTTFLGLGAPFDPETWLEELRHAWKGSDLTGLVVVVPGGDGPETIIALTRDATDYLRSVRDCWTEMLGAPANRDAAVLPFGSSEAAARALMNPPGDVVIVLADNPLAESVAKTPVPEGAPRWRINASDTVHAILTDEGLVVTNRTDLRVELEIRVGDARGNVLTELSADLEPRGSITFTDAQLGEVEALPPPVAVLRQWSHEGEGVDEGGERRLQGITVRYCAPDTGELLAQSTFGNPNSLVSAVVSPEISRSLGRHVPTMARRLAEIGNRDSWRQVFAALVR